MQIMNHGHEGRLQELGDTWARQGGQQFDIAIIVLAAVNVAAACTMVAIIIYDAYMLAKLRSNSLSRNRPHLRLHPAEIPPLFISIAIIIQGTVFVVVQSTSRDVVTGNCKATAQVIWPALWIVPFTILVFGLETTFRALHYKHFQVQKRWNIVFCLIVICIMTLVTWIPSNVSPARHGCLTSLVWWTEHLAKVGLAVASGLIITYVVCAVIVTAQLLRGLKMSREQRIAATMIVYYLISSSMITALVIPFFARTTMRKPAIEASQVAEIALNVLGIIHLIFHVFLRSNANVTAIRPRPGACAKKHRSRVFGASDPDRIMHITSPVLSRKEKDNPFDNDNHKLMKDLRRFSHAAKYQSPSLATDTRTSPPTVPKSPAKPGLCKSVQSAPKLVLSPCTPRKSSNYSIFPTFRSAMLRNSTSTTFSEDNEEVPPLPNPLLPFSHKREFSEQSSATVHFMYRLSNTNGASPPPISPTSSSFRVPLYGTDGTGIESPPISPMSAPTAMGGGSQDTIVLPIQTVLDQDGNRWRRSRSGYLSPGWLGRRKSRSRSQQERYRRMTMKSLPPDPPVEDCPRPPDHNARREP
ncbi:MAG: hypothetical protein Q9184_007305 [Pyrenodesmia sp. 2 TL-2023]